MKAISGALGWNLTGSNQMVRCSAAEGERLVGVKNPSGDTSSTKAFQWINLT